MISCELLCSHSYGEILFAPLRLQILPGRYREPDLLLLLNKDDPRNQDAYWLGADLVVEIVSPDDPERDTVVKRADYAEAGIPEYWIVNPLDETITVLTLTNREYAEHGIFQRGCWQPHCYWTASASQSTKSSTHTNQPSPRSQRRTSRVTRVKRRASFVHHADFRVPPRTYDEMGTLEVLGS